ncbi:Mu transposase C-terminal domain-containing protein [Methylobacterium ajmalii]|uniref:Mu transposase C-terminal domain-containing protein n=1 Tax=Methylobacterium ajmalii TaxID=2738439 RepID=A0ABU9ZXR2_9HYPH
MKRPIVPAAANLRLNHSDGLTVDGTPYRVISESESGFVFQNISSGLHEGFERDRIAALSLAGRIEFSARHHGALAVRTRLEAGCNSLAGLPPGDQVEVVRRLNWLTRLLKREAAQKLANAGKPRRELIGLQIRSKAWFCKNLREIQDEIDAEAAARSRPPRKDGTPAKPRKPRYGGDKGGYYGPGLRTVRKWLADYERAGRNPLALRPKFSRCGNRTPRYAPEVEKLLLEHAAGFASEKKPTREGCHKKLRATLDELNAQRKAQGLPPFGVPSDRTLCRRIAALDEFLVMARREGLEAATRTHRFILGEAEAIRPGQRVEMDEWKIDLFVLLSSTDLLDGLSEEQKDDLRKRRWMLCVAIDVATRCILALRLDTTSSVRNAASTLEMVVSDKRRLADAAGARAVWESMALRPEVVVTDSGSSFISDDFHLAVIALGSAHDVPPAGMPHLRGSIERLFRTISLQLVREFTGQTFENSVARGDYPAMDRASVTIETVALTLVRYAVDVYHNLPHEGLGGETPAHAWKRLTDLYGIIPVPGRNERRAIFGLRIERTLGRHGLRFMGLDYQADVLRRHYLQRGGVGLAVKVDPQDIGAISVEIEGTWHDVRAATSGFDGIRLADHMALCTRLRQQYADQAQMTEALVLEALRAIQARTSEAERAANFLTRFAEPDDIARAEKNLLEFVIPTDADFAGRTVVDPLATAIPVVDPLATTIPIGRANSSPDDSRAAMPAAPATPRRSVRPTLRVEPDERERSAPKKRPGLSIDD